jgi:multisubunit Na+/H+ antiporter MnhB subunit
MADFERRDPIDWEGVERSPDFRALVAGRRRFVALAGGGTVGLTVAFIVVAYVAPDVLGTTLGWVAGVGLIAAASSARRTGSPSPATTCRLRRRARRVSILVGLAFAVAASAKRAAFSRFGEDRVLSRDYLHRSSDGP